MSLKGWLIVAALVVVEFFCCVHWAPMACEEPARKVSARQLCKVKDSIRWRERAWDAGKCERIAKAFNATRDPVRMAAMAINESDLRADAIRVSSPGVYDLGLMGVRCVTDGAHARAVWRSSGVTNGKNAQQQAPRGRCTNGPARGLFAHQLLDPEINIKTAAAVLAGHRGNEHRYNGATTSDKGRRYVGKLDAIEAALLGKRAKPGDERTKKLCGQIRAAVGTEIRS